MFSLGQMNGLTYSRVGDEIRILGASSIQTMAGPPSKSDKSLDKAVNSLLDDMDSGCDLSPRQLYDQACLKELKSMPYPDITKFNYYD